MKPLFFNPLILICTLLLPAYSHLSSNSLSIKGGESFSAGAPITITWRMAHAHTYAHLIYFKADSNSTWSLIDSVKGQSGKLDYSFIWNVPQAASSSAQIKIFLPEFSRTPGEKSDDFNLISKVFTILATTGIVAPVYRNDKYTETTGKTAVVFDLSGRFIGKQVLIRMAERKTHSCRLIKTNGNSARMIEYMGR